MINKLFGKKNDYCDDLLERIGTLNKKLSDYEENMIINIIKLSSITVKEIMVPRVDLVSINKDLPYEEIVKLIEEKGRTRLPVFDENYDNIIGVVHAKDMLKFQKRNKEYNLESIIRPAYFVPETKPINDLLKEFREKRVHLSVVVDEYGGISGIACLEDIIEQIVGEIQDEFDDEAADIVEISEDCYLVNGRLSLNELNDGINADFEAEDIDTLGGLIYSITGKIPSKNEKIEYRNYIFTIESISDRKIRRVKIERLKDKSNED